MFAYSAWEKTRMGALILGAAFAAQAQTITGTVQDAASKAAIEGATVTLLSDPTVTGTSDATGAFTLALPQVGVRGASSAHAGMALRGDRLSFSVGPRSADVSVQLFDFHGRLVRDVFHDRVGSGSYTLAAAPAGLRPGMYLLRARVGADSRSFKLSSLGHSVSAPGLIALGSPMAAKTTKVAAGGVDWLVVTKTGYLKNNTEIMAYTDAQSIMLAASAPATTALKIFSDSASLPQIDWANAAIYSWDQTTTLVTDSSHIGFGGSVAVMQATPAMGASWSGWAFHVAVLANGNQPTADLSPYANGALHFAIKGNAPSLGVMMSSKGQPAGSAPLVDLSTKGYAPDSAWHEISIPVSDFSDGTLDLSSIFVYAGFVSPAVQGGAFDANSSYYIDEVYFTPTK